MKKLLAILLLVIAAAATMGPAVAGEGIQLLENADFDGSTIRAGDLSPWTVKNGNGDKLKCVQVIRAPPLPFSAPCMFLFKGGATPTVLQQNVAESTLAAIDLSCAGATLYPEARIHTKNPTDLRLSVKVNYDAGETQFKLKVNQNLTPLPDTWSPQGTAGVPLAAGANLKKVTYQLRHADPSGKVYIDNAELYLAITPVCS